MLETTLFAAISIIILAGCAYGLYYITRAYWPEIKEIVYAQWLNFLSRFRREPPVNGDIIVLEDLIERPVNEENYKSIKTLAHEVFDAGFDNYREISRFYDMLDKLYEKYGNESYYINPINSASR